MIDQDEKGISYTGGFFILIAFCIAGLVFAEIISDPIWKAMTGLPSKKFMEGMMDPANSDAVKVKQSISSIFGFFIPTLVVASLINRRPIKLLGYRGSISFRQICIVMGILVTALLVANSLGWLTDQIPLSDTLKERFTRAEKENTNQLIAVMKLDSVTDYILSMFVLGFLPAFCEETLFRGGLQNFLTKATKTPWVSILIVSIIFSLAHFSFYGFLTRFFLGIVLGLIFQYTGRLWLSIFAHFLNNAFLVTIIYVSKLQGRPVNEIVEDSGSTYWFFILIPLVIGLLLWLRKISKRDSVSPPAIPDENQNTFST